MNTSSIHVMCIGAAVAALTACGETESQSGAGGSGTASASSGAASTVQQTSSGTTVSTSGNGTSSATTTVASASSTGSDGATTASSSSGSTSSGIVTLSNVDSLSSCSSAYLIFPELPDQAGFYVATRLTPPQAPFVVTSLGYDLGPGLGPSCANVPFDIQLYVSSADAPSESPDADMTLVQTLHTTPTPNDFVTETPLDAPITLQPGEHLFVAVELAAENGERLCIGMCAESATNGVDFWGGAAAPPFAWEDFVDLFGANLTARAYGYVP